MFCRLLCGKLLTCPSLNTSNSSIYFNARSLNAAICILHLQHFGDTNTTKQCRVRTTKRELSSIIYYNGNKVFILLSFHDHKITLCESRIRVCTGDISWHVHLCIRSILFTQTTERSTLDNKKTSVQNMNKRTIVSPYLSVLICLIVKTWL